MLFPLRIGRQNLELHNVRDGLYRSVARMVRLSLRYPFREDINTIFPGPLKTQPFVEFIVNYLRRTIERADASYSTANESKSTHEIIMEWINYCFSAINDEGIDHQPPASIIVRIIERIGILQTAGKP